MIRVLHVLSSLHLGGSQAFVMNIYKQIDREKTQFDFVVFPEERKDLYETVEQMGGRIFVCPRYNGKNHFAYCKWWNEFFKEHTEYKIVHGHNRSTSAIYLSTAKKYGLVTIAHSHSTSNGTGTSSFIKDVMQWPTRYIADYLFACSDSAGRWMFGKDVTQKGNYKVIRNGIDCAAFAFDDHRRNELREKLNISECFIVGNIGRLSEPKNHAFLIEAFALVHQRNPKTKLLLVGDGELMGQVKKQCAELGIAESVVFAGAKTNTADYYLVMDVFAFPSLWEGLGIVAIEAQASGLPVVVSENVPEDVKLTLNIKTVPLSQGAASWANELLAWNKKNDRADGCQEVIDAGYDISQIAKEMQTFYLKLNG